MAARSPARSRAGPEVMRKPTSSSTATIAARLVLPSPGGPGNSRWSGGSPRLRADSSTTPSCSRVRAWPTNSASRRGRRLPSPAPSPGMACGARMSVIGAPPASPWAGQGTQGTAEQLLGGQLTGVSGQRLERDLDLGRPVAERAERVADLGVGGPGAVVGWEPDLATAELALQIEDEPGGQLGADPAGPQELLERAPLVGAGEPVQGEGDLAHIGDGVHQHLGAPGQRGEPLRGEEDLVADAPDLDHGAVGQQVGEPPPQAGDHRTPPRPTDRGSPSGFPGPLPTDRGSPSGFPGPLPSPGEVGAARASQAATGAEPIAAAARPPPAATPRCCRWQRAAASASAVSAGVGVAASPRVAR